MYLYLDEEHRKRIEKKLSDELTKTIDKMILKKMLKEDRERVRKVEERKRKIAAILK